MIGIKSFYDYHLEYRPTYCLQSHYVTVIIGSLNMHYSDVRRDSGKAGLREGGIQGAFSVVLCAQSIVSYFLVRLL